MLISAKDAIDAARALKGTPYAEIDCINLIKSVIRTSPGGEKSYTTAGTNTLWRSANAAARYRDLTWRQESTDGAKAGMLAFKRSGDNVHHVGLVTYEGTVIHASSAHGCVVETDLDRSWNLLAVHRLIAPDGFEADGDPGEITVYPSMRVNTESTSLNIRERPSASSRSLGRVKKGDIVDVTGEARRDEMGRRWLPVTAKAENRRNAVSGWACAEYLIVISSEAEEKNDAPEDENADEADDDVPVPRTWLLELCDALKLVDDADTKSGVDEALVKLYAASSAVRSYVRGND